MTLEQVAQQAMDYLDSVGVAAEYDIIKCERFTTLRVITDMITLEEREKYADTWMLRQVKAFHPQKSPA